MCAGEVHEEEEGEVEIEKIFEEMMTKQILDFMKTVNTQTQAQ